MSDQEYEHVIKMVRTALYWWARHYRKNDVLYVPDFCDLPDEVIKQYSTDKLYDFDTIADDTVRIIDQISDEEIKRLVDVSQKDKYS